jgi:hypothetical protein
MSREDVTVLTCLSAVPVWAFVVLPLYYGGVPMVTIIPIVISMFALGVAFFGVWVAREQLSLNRTSQNNQLELNRRNQRETTAKTNFREFLKLCVDYPDLANGKPSEENGATYSWFVAHFLWAAEEILEFSPEPWVSNLELHVAYHKDYFDTDTEFRTKDFRTYTDKLRDFLMERVPSLRRC